MPARADKGHRDGKLRRDWERSDWSTFDASRARREPEAAAARRRVAAERVEAAQLMSLLRETGEVSVREDLFDVHLQELVEAADDLDWCVESHWSWGAIVTVTAVPA